MSNRQQRRAKQRRPMKQRRRGTTMFTILLLLIVAGGAAAIAISRSNPPPITRGASVGEHWHASYEIHICGQRLANFPTVEGEVHSHGDGFIHLHPSSPAGAGDLANLGAFLRLYETSLVANADGDRSLTLADGTTYADGDTCESADGEENGEPQEIVVTDNGERVTDDPSQLIPHDGDSIVIAFGDQAQDEDDILPNPYNEQRGITDVPTEPDQTQAPD